MRAFTGDRLADCEIVSLFKQVGGIENTKSVVAQSKYVVYFLIARCSTFCHWVGTKLKNGIRYHRRNAQVRPKSLDGGKEMDRRTW